MARRRRGTTDGEEGVISAQSEYVTKPDAEIRKLALDIHSGQVFVSWQMHDHEMSLLTMVFLPLALMSDFDHLAIKRDKITHFYGHMKDASPRAINGLPMFMSVGMLNHEDSTRIVKELKAIDAYLTGETTSG